MMLPQIRGWVAEAAEIARRSYNVVGSWRKRDGSLVTEADKSIERLLRERITEAYPDHAIVGEEQGSGRSADYLWALDPIDGTASFVHGLPIWGISVGLLHRGRPVLGCFYMPVLDEWYETDLEGPALFNSHPIEVARTDLEDSESWICVPSNVHRRYTISYRGKVRVLGSIAAYIAYVARGTAAGALLGRAQIWDMAGSLPVLERAGGSAAYLVSGRPVDLSAMLQGQSSAEPILVGSPEAITMLRERISLWR